MATIQKNRHNNYSALEMKSKSFLLVIGEFTVFVILALIFGFFWNVFTTHAADTGWLVGTVNGTDTCGGGSGWTNGGNIYTSDNQYAVSSAGLLKKNSQCIKVTGFTTGIPIGSTINGIQAQLEKNENAAGSGHISDDHVNLVLSGSAIGLNYAKIGNYTATDVTHTYGTGVNDMRGTTVTQSDVTDSTFGIEASGKWSGTTGSRGFNYDMLQIKIYYTPPIVTQTLFKSYLLRALIPTAFASTTCEFVTDTTSGGHHTTTTAECSDPVATTTPIINQPQDTFNGIILALGIASLMAFFLIKIKERR